jgi:uncharacterized protein YcfJ
MGYGFVGKFSFCFKPQQGSPFGASMGALIGCMGGAPFGGGIGATFGGIGALMGGFMCSMIVPIPPSSSE